MPVPQGLASPLCPSACLGDADIPADLIIRRKNGRNLPAIQAAGLPASPFLGGNPVLEQGVSGFFGILRIDRPQRPRGVAFLS